MKAYRKLLIEWLFKVSQSLYVRLFKSKQPWYVTKEELILYPRNTLGYHLGHFLKTHNFELLPKVERHDCYHVVTGYGTTVEDEIALQFLCYANGKRSPYLLGVIIIGSLLLPEYYRYYVKSYAIGKEAHPFHQYDYQKLLTVDISAFRSSIFSKKLHHELNFQ